MVKYKRVMKPNSVKCVIKKILYILMSADISIALIVGNLYSK